MADNMINITLPEVSSHSTSIRTSNTDLTAALLEAKQAIESILGSSWQGAPVDGMKAKMTALQTKFDTYQQIIDDYAKFLDKTVDRYTTTDAQVSQNVQALQQ